MGEFDATLGMGLMADDLAEEILKRADGSYEEASAALTEFAHGVQERLSELSKARHLVAELAVTDERFAEFGKRVAADMGAGDWSNTTRKHLGRAIGATRRGSIWGRRGSMRSLSRRTIGST